MLWNVHANRSPIGPASGPAQLVHFCHGVQATRLAIRTRQEMKYNDPQGRVADHAYRPVRLADCESDDHTRAWRLCQIIRQRERMATTAAAQRVARLRADFENDRFASRLTVNWYSAGEQASKERRAELRTLATKEIEAAEKRSRVAPRNAGAKACAQPAHTDHPTRLFCRSSSGM